MIKKYKYITLSKEERLALKTVLGDYQIQHGIAGVPLSGKTLESEMVLILSNLLERSTHKVK